jgi:dual specificity MAP kinase phosphatase
VHGLVTPPSSPPSTHAVLKPSSLLDPPTGYKRLQNDPPVYDLSAAKLVKAIDHLASQPLPDTKEVFPWLHGLHCDNIIQLGFFMARKKAMRKVPQCLRGIAIVKCGGDLNTSKLRGALSPDELLLEPSHPKDLPCFHEIDPRDGFSVRNFQIQACKMATVSDIVVYGDAKTPRDEVLKLAKSISQAQKIWKQRQLATDRDTPTFHTFVVTENFETIEKRHPQLVAIDSRGFMTGKVPDFFFWERKEMCIMSKASEISKNVYLGPTPDPQMQEHHAGDPDFDIFVEANDLAQVANEKALKQLKSILDEPGHPKLHIEAPASGSIMPPSWSHAEVDGLLATCKWMYEAAHAQNSDEKDEDEGDSIMLSAFHIDEKKILIHCTDGYTESSLLALAYFMYAEGLPVHDAWVRLHTMRGRNFFAYPSDVSLLRSIQPRILQESPAFKGNVLKISEPSWLSKLDGSLPSRILPYMYLGNLNHANNPALLKELGITRILSVGESISWSQSQLESWGAENLLFIDRVQDNGVDSLTEEFERCLNFIERGKLDGEATLVHCRVGVSRSATICIAEVMKEMRLSFPRAYCFVRARRLNVIIQPHLRFM